MISVEAFSNTNPIEVKKDYHFAQAERLFNQEDEHYSKRLEDALYHYARSAVVSPDTPLLSFYNMGRISYVLGDIDTSLYNFEKQLAIFGSYLPNIHYTLGLTYGDLGRRKADLELLSKAEEHLNSFLEYMPEGQWAWTDLAWVKYWQEDYEGMRKAAFTGLQYHPNQPWLLNVSAISLMNLQEYEEATKLLQQAQQQAQTVTVADWRKAYTENNPVEYSKGLADFRKSIAYNLSLAQVKGNESLVKLPDLDIFERELIAQGKGIVIPACGHSTPTPSCSANQGNSCTSSSNSCGMTNSGTIQCNGTCSASTPSDSSCPPAANLRAQIKPDSTYYSNSVSITPYDELKLSWSSSYANSCSTNFGGSGTSGTRDVTPSLNPGESKVYEVTCTGPGGSNSDYLTARVPDILVDVFKASPWVVRSGEKSTLEWKLELSESLSATPSGDLIPYSYGCEIQGATADGSPHTFNASTNNGEGSILTRELTNKYINSLSCSSYVYDETEVEVVPGIQEI